MSWADRRSAFNCLEQPGGSRCVAEKGTVWRKARYAKVEGWVELKGPNRVVAFQEI